MKNYFSGLTTAAEIKAVYKCLCTIHHPDNGGDTATMQEINRQRTAALAALEEDAAPADEPASVILLPEECPTRTDIPAALLELLEAARRLPCLHLEVCGSWLWATGSTKPVKDQLKALGFHFSANKKAWYWHDPSEKRRFRSRRRYSMDEIREAHGSRVIA